VRFARRSRKPSSSRSSIESFATLERRRKSTRAGSGRARLSERRELSRGPSRTQRVLRTVHLELQTSSSCRHVHLVLLAAAVDNLRLRKGGKVSAACSKTRNASPSTTTTTLASRFRREGRRNYDVINFEDLPRQLTGEEKLLLLADERVDDELLLHVCERDVEKVREVPRVRQGRGLDAPFSPRPAQSTPRRELPSTA